MSRNYPIKKLHSHRYLFAYFASGFISWKIISSLYNTTLKSLELMKYIAQLFSTFKTLLERHKAFTSFEPGFARRITQVLPHRSVLLMEANPHVTSTKPLSHYAVLVS